MCGTNTPRQTHPHNTQTPTRASGRMHAAHAHRRATVRGEQCFTRAASYPSVHVSHSTAHCSTVRDNKRAQCSTVQYSAVSRWVCLFAVFSIRYVLGQRS